MLAMLERLVLAGKYFDRLGRPGKSVAAIVALAPQTTSVELGDGALVLATSPPPLPPLSLILLLLATMVLSLAAVVLLSCDAYESRIRDSRIVLADY